jgi:5-methylcytosine-specific restriction protein A
MTLRSRRAKPGFGPAAKALILARSSGICELDACGPVEHYHHRAPRGAGGTSLDWINRPANCLALSARCHNRVEQNRNTAYENGWLIPRNQQPIAEEKAVLYRGRRVLLSDDGSLIPAPIEDGAA